MDEVEGAVFLNSKHASALLGHAGGKGKNRSAQTTEPSTSVHVLVLGGEKGLVRIFKVALEGKSAASFSCTPLATFGVHELGLTDIAGSGGGVGGGGGGKSEKAPHSINSIHYLETKSELLLSTKDAHFFSFRLKGGSILAKRQFVGSHDDVLDISCLPERRGSLQQGAEGGDSAAAPARLAVATNSAVVRLMSCGSSECQLLHGHTDIVLALDSSLDG